MLTLYGGNGISTDLTVPCFALCSLYVMTEHRQGCFSEGREVARRREGMPAYINEILPPSGIQPDASEGGKASSSCLRRRRVNL